MIVSSSCTEYPRVPPLDADALLKRGLVWSSLPKTIYRGTISYLSVEDCLNLDSAVTNGEMRPHLVKAYDSLVSAAFNGYLYTERGVTWLFDG